MPVVAFVAVCEVGAPGRARVFLGRALGVDAHWPVGVAGAVAVAGALAALELVDALVNVQDGVAVGRGAGAVGVYGALVALPVDTLGGPVGVGGAVGVSRARCRLDRVQIDLHTPEMWVSRKLFFTVQYV